MTQMNLVIMLLAVTSNLMLVPAAAGRADAGWASSRRALLASTTPVAGLPPSSTAPVATVQATSISPITKPPSASTALVGKSPKDNTTNLAKLSAASTAPVTAIPPSSPSNVTKMPTKTTTHVAMTPTQDTTHVANTSTPSTAPAAGIPAGFKKIVCTIPKDAPKDEDLTYFCSNGPMAAYNDNIPCSKASVWGMKFPNAPDVCCSNDTYPLGYGGNGDINLDKCITKPGTVQCSKIKGYEQKLCCLAKTCNVMT